MKTEFLTFAFPDSVYMDLVEKFCILADLEISRWEKIMASGKHDSELATAMPALISIVNTIGYLRGQDGMFDDSRSPGVDNKKLYQYEDAFEKRLRNLINYIKNSKMKDWYIQRLTDYFIKARS